MRIYKTKNYDEMSRKAANIISAQIILKPESVLGLATGSSPIGTYKQLIEWYNKGDLDFSPVKRFWRRICKHRRFRKNRTSRILIMGRKKSQFPHLYSM